MQRQRRTWRANIAMAMFATHTLMLLALARSVKREAIRPITVPLCNTHHDQLHRSGDERAFWARNGFQDPLKYAARLWAASRDQRIRVTTAGNETLDPDLEAEFNEPRLRKGSPASSPW
jgi:hypothetical protein